MERPVLPFPVLPGVDAELIARRFLKQPQQYAKSRKPVDITLGRASQRTTPMGNFVVAYRSMGAAGV
jgi:hypothetical protein